MNVQATIRFGIGKNPLTNELEVKIPFNELEVLANEGIIPRCPQKLQELQAYLLTTESENYHRRRQTRMNSDMWNRRNNNF